MARVPPPRPPGAPAWYRGRPYAAWRGALHRAEDDVVPMEPASCIATDGVGSTTWSIDGPLEVV